MPRSHRLTWQAGARGRIGRWRKKYKGEVHYFSGGRGKSDSAAYQAALSAWEAMKVKIDGQTPRPHEEEYRIEIGKWEQVLAWCNKHGEKITAEIAEEKLSVLRKKITYPILKPLDRLDCFDSLFDAPVLPHLADFWEAINRTLGIENQEQKHSGIFVVPNEDCFLPVDYRERIQKVVWQDRLDVQQQLAAANENNLHAHVELFLREKENCTKTGDVSVGRYYATKLHLTAFQDFHGKNRAVTEIDARTLMTYRSYLLEKVVSGKWSRTTAKHYLATVKSFVRWLWQIEAIPTLPRNLVGKTNALDIGRPLKEVIIFSKEEIKILLDTAPNRTKLYILLMLNCGMTQKDIADLKSAEVSWEEGRIVRKRSKTAKFENVPTVGYWLWPETKRLLLQERAMDSSERLLLNSNGRPLWSEEIGQTGKYRKTDNIKNAFDRLRSSTKIRKPLKSLKKTSATLIRNNEKYTSLESLFLGHAPQIMSDKHYSHVPQGLLDQAIIWLGQEYGMC